MIYTMVAMGFFVVIDVMIDIVPEGEPVTNNDRKKPGCLRLQAGSLTYYFLREAISITKR